MKDMLIKSPIFLGCFARGGSTILMNLLLSHPDVCSAIRQTQGIFGSRWPHITIAGSLVVALSRQWTLFDPRHMKDRRPLTKSAGSFIDRTLYHWKLKTLSHHELRYKSESEIYAREEVENARLVLKNNNGLVFMTEVFAGMYPDATFINMSRHPLPLFESYKRRGIERSPERFSQFYEEIAVKMALDCERRPNCRFIRFEDVLSDPLGSFNKLYRIAGLDGEMVQKIRLRAMKTIQPDGQHRTSLVPLRHYWFNRQNLNEILESNINEYQARRVDERDNEIVMRLTEKSRRLFGYA